MLHFAGNLWLKQNLLSRTFAAPFAARRAKPQNTAKNRSRK